MRLDGRKKKWQIPCEGFFVLSHLFFRCDGISYVSQWVGQWLIAIASPSFASLLLLYFLFYCRFTAREEMAERMAAFQPKKNEVFQPGNVTIGWSACPEGFVWLCWPTWQEIWGPWKGPYQEPQRQWQVKTMNRSDRNLLCSGIVWEPNKIRP